MSDDNNSRPLQFFSSTDEEETVTRAPPRDGNTM